ncbi:MAG: D-alanyl-D-alanine carboxypeptidase/D-alanyl-D-alanine-endopeptidase [Actinomycetota bacterium]
MPRIRSRLVTAAATVMLVAAPPGATPAPPAAAGAVSPAPSPAGQPGPEVGAPGPRPSDVSQRVAGARPLWMKRIDRLVGRKSFGVAIEVDDHVLYKRAAVTRRIPASNQKLLLSMSLLARFDPESRLQTTAATGGRKGNVVTGNLWLLGTGDPWLGTRAAYGRRLPAGMTSLHVLARRVADSGIRSIRGGVIGSTGYFSHDWWAPGWKAHFPAYYVALPSALTFNGNLAGGRHISDPERRAATWFTRKLEKLGVRVRRRPAAEPAPQGLTEVASIKSKPLQILMRYMNVRSSNTVAELLGKRLGVNRFGRPGTIAKGARAVRAWARRHGVDIESLDSSGLSYRNRISARGMARLLDRVEEKPWGALLRGMLPAPGQGTLADRLRGVRVRAKTGTLDRVSTLSGWVWLSRTQQWASFSIMSSGLPKSKAADIENRIVRILHERAR